MRVKRYVLVSAAVLAAGAGGGAAIAATSGDDEHKKAEQAVIDDAAKRLNVSPEALRNALGAAEDAQLDQAVKDGKLTQDQADAIKKRRQQSGAVLGGPGVAGVHPGFGGRGGGLGLGGAGGIDFKTGPGGALDAAASALGLKRDALIAKLRGGKSIADVAKDQNKSLDDVKTAITDAVTKELDQAVKDNKVTSARRDEVLKELTARLDDLVNLKPPARPSGSRSGTPPAPFGPGGGRGHHWR
jgi:hypothetical protein